MESMDTETSTSEKSLIYELALNTYKAIYGKEPPHIPYKDASHTPFRGLDPELVKSLLNETEVKKFLREWKKDNTSKTISLYSFVSDYYYVVGIYKDSLYAIQNIETGGLKYRDSCSPVIPKPAQADILREAVIKTKNSLHLYVEETPIEHISGLAKGYITNSFRVDKSNELFKDSIAIGSVKWTTNNLSAYDIEILPIHKVNLL